MLRLYMTFGLIINNLHSISIIFLSKGGSVACTINLWQLIRIRIPVQNAGGDCLATPLSGTRMIQVLGLLIVAVAAVTPTSSVYRD